MKLRNLLFATMFAVAFVGCSNDDDPIITPETGGDTTLALKMANIESKADDDAIANLTVIVAYNGGENNGKIEAVKTVTTGLESGEITLTAGSKKMIVLANADVAAFTENSLYSAVAAATTTFDKEAVDALSMNSKEYTLDIAPGTKNYIGYSQEEAVIKAGTENTKPIVVLDAAKVKMYRNVAKVNIVKIEAGAKMSDGDNYPNPSFEMEEIVIVQSPGTSALVGAASAEWGPTFDAANFIMPWSTSATWDAAGIGSIYDKAAFGKYESRYSKEEAATVGYVKDEAAKVYTGAVPFYVYENLNTDGDLTLMAVKGTFWYDGLDVDGKTVIRKKLDDRYFPFAVGVTGFDEGYDIPAGFDAVAADRTFTGLAAGKAIGVLRNLQYNVSMTLNGIGYPTPWGPPPGGEKATLDVYVQVVGWGQVDQPVVIP